jgi:hypothetical protein
MFLREEQKILLDTLSRRSTPLGEIYLGGLKIFMDDANPFRHQLAAHAFRELIDHLAKSTGAVVVKGDGTRSRLVPVRKAFVALTEANGLTNDLSRDLSGLSEALNVELRKFFSWQYDNQPERRLKTAVMLTQLAGPGPALPSDVIGDEISSWVRSHDYFNSVAHGGKRAERDEFVSKLYSVEDILLRRVNPRPLSDLDEIDALIQEGNNAD